MVISFTEKGRELNYKSRNGLSESCEVRYDFELF